MNLYGSQGAASIESCPMRNSCNGFSGGREEAEQGEEVTVVRQDEGFSVSISP
jgi:hypothetical protein